MFKVGQKVVCVRTHPNNLVIEGKIYTITSIKQICSCNSVVVNNMPSKFSKEFSSIVMCADCNAICDNDGYSRFFANRFKPLDETFAEDVLANIKEQIEEEYLVLV